MLIPESVLDLARVACLALVSEFPRIAAMISHFPPTQVPRRSLLIPFISQGTPHVLVDA